MQYEIAALSGQISKLDLVKLLTVPLDEDVTLNTTATAAQTTASPRRILLFNDLLIRRPVVNCKLLDTDNDWEDERTDFVDLFTSRVLPADRTKPSQTAEIGISASCDLRLPKDEFHSYLDGQRERRAHYLHLAAPFVRTAATALPLTVKRDGHAVNPFNESAFQGDFESFSALGTKKFDVAGTGGLELYRATLLGFLGFMETMPQIYCTDGNTSIGLSNAKYR
ncbi:MAG: hypothetical protein HYS81_04630 [Candidatus Aenigmatarchaeota archaeon]|nr:MAG: hypothetical protein HYS81_04630 [Candidatus Aenigmarchaeota archaeon]